MLQQFRKTVSVGAEVTSNLSHMNKPVSFWFMLCISFCMWVCVVIQFFSSMASLFLFDSGCAFACHYRCSRLPGKACLQNVLIVMLKSAHSLHIDPLVPAKPGIRFPSIRRTDNVTSIHWLT